MSQFAEQIRDFAKKTNTKSETLVKAVSLHLLRDMVQGCPVDTGLAKNSFYFGFVRVNTVGDTENKSGADSFARGAAFTTENQLAGSVFYITNNLQYIQKLEHGSSKQAPVGFARIAVERWQKHVDSVAREVNK